jgi:hypothetical protein
MPLSIVGGSFRATQQGDTAEVAACVAVICSLSAAIA